MEIFVFVHTSVCKTGGPVGFQGGNHGVGVPADPTGRQGHPALDLMSGRNLAKQRNRFSCFCCQDLFSPVTFDARRVLKSMRGPSMRTTEKHEVWPGRDGYSFQPCAASFLKPFRTAFAIASAISTLPRDDGSMEFVKCSGFVQTNLRSRTGN